MYRFLSVCSSEGKATYRLPNMRVLRCIPGRSSTRFTEIVTLFASLAFELFCMVKAREIILGLHYSPKCHILYTSWHIGMELDFTYSLLHRLVLHLLLVQFWRQPESRRVLLIVRSLSALRQAINRDSTTFSSIYIAINSTARPWIHLYQIQEHLFIITASLLPIFELRPLSLDSQIHIWSSYSAKETMPQAI